MLRSGVVSGMVRNGVEGSCGVDTVDEPLKLTV